MGEQITFFPVSDINSLKVHSKLSDYQIFKINNRYRLSKDTNKCKNCLYLTSGGGNVRGYYKCELIGVSNSSATDIRLKNVCDKWDSLTRSHK